MTSNFEKVKLFNKAFGVQTNTVSEKNLFDTNPKLVQYRLDLIIEEVQELQVAIKQKDFTEVIDAIGDILYVVYGAATAFGFSADKAFQIIQDSNMSKLCKTEEDAIMTVKLYKEELPQRYDSPNYRLSEDGIHWVVFNQSTMKILKNYKYVPANFTSII